MTDAPEVEALVDDILRLKRPALFEGDWRSKQSGARTAKWIAELEADASEVVACVLASDWLAAREATAEARGAQAALLDLAANAGRMPADASKAAAWLRARAAAVLREQIAEWLGSEALTVFSASPVEVAYRKGWNGALSAVAAQVAPSREEET